MTDDIRWIDALPAKELWEGDVVDVDIAGETVLLVHHLGGDIKAFQGMCPHQEVLLVDGDWNEDTCVLICPGHRWEFDLRSGAGINPDDCRLSEYPVRIEDDQVRIGFQKSPVPEEAQ